jgi:hypothetical protein
MCAVEQNTTLKEAMRKQLNSGEKSKQAENSPSPTSPQLMGGDGHGWPLLS